MPSLEAGPEAPLFQRLRVVGIEIHRVFVGQQLERVGADERGHGVREDVLLVFAKDLARATATATVPAVALFLAATQRDPQFAPAFAGLADSYVGLGTYGARAEDVRDGLLGLRDERYVGASLMPARIWPAGPPTRRSRGCSAP